MVFVSFVSDVSTRQWCVPLPPPPPSLASFPRSAAGWVSESDETRVNNRDDRSPNGTERNEEKKINGMYKSASFACAVCRNRQQFLSSNQTYSTFNPKYVHIIIVLSSLFPSPLPRAAGTFAFHFDSVAAAALLIWFWFRSARVVSIAVCAGRALPRAHVPVTS